MPDTYILPDIHVNLGGQFVRNFIITGELNVVIKNMV